MIAQSSSCRFFVWTLLLAVAFVQAATTDPICVSACSEWSIALGYCHEIYGAYPQRQNYTFGNDFLTCLCDGTQRETTLGYDEMQTAAGTCLGCESTPARIQTDLSTLLELCTIQNENGTAAGVVDFMPQGYTISESDTGMAEGGMDSSSIHQMQPASWALYGLVAGSAGLLSLII